MLVERYEIVPVNDGCHFLCVNLDTGEYVWQYKPDKVPAELKPLYFRTEWLAKRYIRKYLSEEKYKPEWFLTKRGYKR